MTTKNTPAWGRGAGGWGNAFAIAAFPFATLQRNRARVKNEFDAGLSLARDRAIVGEETSRGIVRVCWRLRRSLLAQR